MHESYTNLNELSILYFYSSHSIHNRDIRTSHFKNSTSNRKMQEAERITKIMKDAERDLIP